ncbi:MAG: hypothetical protein ACKO40_08075 [Planctomycetaceae bacterium]
MKKTFGWMLCSMSWATVALVSVGTATRAEDLNLAEHGHGVVDGLAVMRDLEPIADVVAASPTSKPSAFTFRTEARASTPAVDRAKSYGSSDPFASSRAVLPLLVVDLTPSHASVARPMTGRSVGARPSLPLARPESR